MGFLRFFWFQWGLLMKLFLKCPQNLDRNSLFSQNPETHSSIKHSVLKRVSSSCSLVQRSASELCHTLWELSFCCKGSPMAPGSRWRARAALHFQLACFSLTSENLLYKELHLHILYLTLFELTLKYTDIPKDFFLCTSGAALSKQTLILRNCLW